VPSFVSSAGRELPLIAASKNYVNVVSEISSILIKTFLLFFSSCSNCRHRKWTKRPAAKVENLIRRRQTDQPASIPNITRLYVVISVIIAIILYVREPKFEPNLLP